MRVCVDNVSFEAAHYTPVNNVPQLHGHTFTVSVCVDGELREDFMVIDFMKLKELVENVVERYRYSLIVPKKDLEGLDIKGPFKLKLVILEYPQATAEAIAMSILDELVTVFKSLGMEVGITLKVFEGRDNYVEVSATVPQKK